MRCKTPSLLTDPSEEFSLAEAPNLEAHKPFQGDSIRKQ